MDQIEVRIVRLEPLRVAASYGFGAGPEELAWQQIIKFYQESGVDQDGAQHRFFGFNNPSPSAGSPNYGYEQWVTVAEDTAASGEIKMKNFPGGLYAVTRTTLRTITEDWHKLFLWREASHYLAANHQWLEECLTPPLDAAITEDMQLDLYIPIAE